MRTSDVVIAGAGIIGLAAALELAGLGLSVAVVEQGSAMAEASWAAAGMLAAGDPENPSQLVQLAEYSHSLYPEFLGTVETLSGQPVPLRTRVALQGLHPGSPTSLAVSGTAGLHQRVPELIQGDYSFIELDETSLDPRDLCRALPIAVRAAGVQLYEQTAVERVVPAAGDALDSPVRVETSAGVFIARHYLDCCGAWAGTRRLGGLALPIEPRKGQILAVTMPGSAPRLDCVLRAPEIYLVPRGDGRIVVGATVEHAGFDRTVSAAATDALLSTAAALWPPIRQGVVTECWTGLRSATPDGLPMLGPVPSQDGQPPHISVATGHFRNGILLAPGTARLMGQLLSGRPPAISMEAFDCRRFIAVSTES
jgi:glycine oxidase